MFACIPMFMCIDSHSEKCVIPHILSSNMPTSVSVCIAQKATGNGKQGTGSVEKSPFSASYRLCSRVLICTPQNRVFPLSSSIRIRFIRSHRPHAAPSKYRSFRDVVLVCVRRFGNMSNDTNIVVNYQ